MATDGDLIKRARKINQLLGQAYPDAGPELDFANPFQLLIATVLSAQTTDFRVNALTPVLFKQFPTAYELAQANPETVEEIIKSTGFFRVKARNIIALSQNLVFRFAGEVPNDLDRLVTLPGVGRKTANVVLGNAFGIPGITVDTHFARLSKRLGFVDEATAKDAVKTELTVGELFDEKDWTQVSHHLIWHGRRCCHAKKPACGACPIAKLCPSFGAGPTDYEKASKLLTTQGPR